MQAKTGDSVEVHYTGKLDDGSVFDSSLQREALQFRIGEGQLIQSFEDAVIGMKQGEAKTVRIAAKEAYGLRDDALVMTLKRSQLPPNIALTLGLHLQMRRPDGVIVNLLVTALTEETATLDANHPLAGEDLTFDIELVRIGQGAHSVVDNRP